MRELNACRSVVILLQDQTVIEYTHDALHEKRDFYYHCWVTLIVLDQGEGAMSESDGMQILS